MSNNIVQRIAMKAVIIRDGKVLLVREASTDPESSQHGRFGLPGGKVEPGETWQDALRREVQEETGITNLEILHPVFVGEWTPTIRGVRTQIIATFHVCNTTEGEVTLSDEHDEYQWVNAESWKLLNVMKPDDEVLTTFFRQASTMKSQD